jgi:serine/threonine protein kinase/TPR repeat protein
MNSPLRFAHFEVLTRSDGSPFFLGQGAMGAAYKALDQNLLSLAVIKVPAPEMQSVPTARQRFLQEAQMMARLRHPHVASVFFFGDSPAGAFYAMEFCEGPTLQEYISENGVMDWGDAFRLALQAASALQALDAHELVHRDLKPTNIILTRDDAGHAHLKLIDFGVAREGLPSDSGGLTQSGFIGTPAYASPEQLLEAAHLDARSDLYALGAVLWFCLTGKPPFEGTQFEVMFHHVNTEPDWGKLPPMPPEALEVMRRLLAKFVEERYNSPAAFLAELQRILGGTVTGIVRLRSAAKPHSADLGGYEPLTEVGTDGFGKVWRARDTLTGRIVALRVFSPEFSSKSALVLRVQRLTAYVRPLEHARLLRVWHFEQSGAECRLATEWVEGPTLLALLKARKTIPLAEVLPLLIQIAEAMDYAAAQGLTAAETAPERLILSLAGWTEMPADSQSNLLRQPPTTWPEWIVKVCPLRLSMSAQDYVLPTDTEAAQSISRITVDFVQLCHRLLTGQGSFVPSPALKEEGNAFFEKHYGHAVSGATCSHLLRQLCLSEGVQMPARDDLAEAMLTRVVPRKNQVPAPSVSSPTAATVVAPRSGTRAETFPPQIVAGASVRLRELEQRRAELDAEAEQLKIDERLKAEQEWLAKEREALDKARREVAAQEAGSARRIAEEQARLAEQRASLEQQQSLLEEKRREQQRLEQEIQLRAQLDFQKLQEEAKSRESQLQHQHIAAEEALRNREAEFRAREQESLARLEALKREASAMELRVSLEARTLRHNELEVTRRQQREKDVGGLAKDTLVAEERRIAQMRADLQARQAQWKSTQKKRNLTFSLGTLAVLLLAAVVAYYMKARIVNISTLPGAEQWEAATSERNLSKTEQRWADLLGWCVVTYDALRTKAEFAETLKKHQGEIEADATEAIAGLLKTSKLPDAFTEDGRKLLMNVEKTRDWNLPAERHLLMAKLRMPEAAARGAGVEALNVYLKAIHANPSFAPLLGNELKLTVDSLRKQLRAGKLEGGDELQKLLREAAKGEARKESSEVVRFIGETLAEQARRSGKPEESLRLLLETAQLNPAWSTDLRAQAAEIVSQLAKLPTPGILPLAATLRKAGDTWRLADAYLALAPIEADEDIRFDDYKLADSFGSMKARALVGRTLLDTGVSRNKPELIQQGISKLREALAANEPEAMVLLGEALYAGHGMTEDAAEALKLAKQAEVAGHPEAFYLAGKAHLRLAELSRDPGQFDAATTLLEKAVSNNLPSAAYFLYLANYNDTVKNPERAVAALEKGAVARDSNCLFNLGLWLTAGQQPVLLNVTRGRTLIQDAATLGHPKARDWLLKHP